jgi:ubiquitin-activating enzyme E1 C
VTYSKTQGVVKNIIPAIASTNAIVAASCCNEALKLATMINPCMGLPGSNNYMMYSGDEGIYTYTFEHLQKPDCPVCGHQAKKLDVSRNMTLGELIETLAVRPEAYVSLVLGPSDKDSQLKKPTLRTSAKSLYYQSPPSLEKQTRPNLDKKLDELVSDGEEVAVSDPAFTINFKFQIRFSD